jgi:hypothetical protein
VRVAGRFYKEIAENGKTSNSKLDTRRAIKKSIRNRVI